MRQIPAIRILLFAISVLCLTGCSINHVIRVEDRERIDVGTMIEELRPAPLVFIGELHDAPSHHQLQLEVIKGLQRSGKPVAIAMEMFEASVQKALDAWVAGKVPVNAFRQVYQWNWRFIPWGLYEDILLYARDNHIPIVGINAPRQLVEQVSRQGFESLSQEEIASLPPGVTADVGQAYLDFIGASYPSHGRKGDSFRRICEAQALRNRFMARTLSAYMAKHPDTTVVVIAGAGHARHKGGIPMELGAVSYRIVVPPIPGLTDRNITTDDADYLMD